MADRELATILNSGEINTAYLAGTAAANKVQTAADVELSLLAVGTTTPLTAQTLVAGVAEKLVWLSTETLKVGSDLESTAVDDEINILTTGIYSIAGTLLLEAPNGNELDFHMRVNGVEASLCNNTTGRGAGKTANVTTHGAISLSALDDVTIWVTSTGTSLEIQGASVTIQKIG